ncbi:MAG: hypothetical protein ACREUU_00635 [Gammaproteobacteria bacterium]
MLSGNEQGVAHLFFSPEGTLAGRGTITGRVLFTYSGRTTGVFTNRGVVYTNIFGGAYLEGNWSYASPTTTNRIVGFIDLLFIEAGSTRRITNALSFSGAARASRLTLLSRGYPGQVMFRGVPLEITNNLTGTYYGTGQKQGAPAPFVEVFDLTAVPELEVVPTTVVTPFDCSTTNTMVATNVGGSTITTITITRQTCLSTNTVLTPIFNPFPVNYYNVQGSGPAYQYSGLLLVSRQKYAAFFQRRGPNDRFITAYAGPFNPATGRGSLVGTDGVNRNIKYSIYHGPVPGGP